MKQTGIYLLLLIGLSFHFGRLFEIFSWNTNIIRIESIAQMSLSDKTSTCSYTHLNDQYWEEKAIEDAKIRIDFSGQYLYLNKISEYTVEVIQNQYKNFKQKFTRLFTIDIIYSDEGLI